MDFGDSVAAGRPACLSAAAAVGINWFVSFSATEKQVSKPIFKWVVADADAQSPWLNTYRSRFVLAYAKLRRSERRSPRTIHTCSPSHI